MTCSGRWGGAENGTYFGGRGGSAHPDRALAGCPDHKKLNPTIKTNHYVQWLAARSLFFIRIGGVAFTPTLFQSF